MAIITLTTDLGLQDHYVSSLKGSIYSEIPDAKIVDISHNVPAFDLFHAAFLIHNVYRDFPKGSIHIIGVRNEATSETPHVAVEYEGHYFIGSDNGIFSLIFDQKPTKVVELKIRQETSNLTFPTRDIFVKAACHIARGGTLEIIGANLETLQEKTMFRPVVEEDVIKGTIIHIDSYGNVFVNINKRLFREIGVSRPFNIYFRGSEYSISKISNVYHEVDEGDMLAIFSATGFMEIAINKGKANKLLGMKLNDIVRVEFKHIGKDDN